MADRDRHLRGFLDFDTQDPAIRDRHQALLEAKLGSAWPLGKKANYAALAVVGLLGFLAAGSLSLTEPPSTPAATRGLLALLSFIGLGWAVFATWALARFRGGFAGERLEASRMALGCCLVALLGLASASAALKKEASAGPLLATGLAFLVVAAVGATNARIEESDLAIREQILRLEARIVEIATSGDESRARTTGESPDPGD